ncbi:hypothetical protein SAMN06265337_2087 [Hymenobacter gelipurpurascens]|uniref:Uncharacterized protein n=1 Tax=Hymenobacter gelipurpurascens TaxID=89968 RepID=A0A212TP92_9BACT|nr:hypothetical protein [Hymenobacter gelipurpurascens]SNC67832.1 hypothetical protein SAMN06265337_2087 [Hymenobacter gelipurpurascens]
MYQPTSSRTYTRYPVPAATPGRLARRLSGMLPTDYDFSRDTLTEEEGRARNSQAYPGYC